MTNLQMDLTNLDAYIAVVENDIEKCNLNVKVKVKRKQLRNIGESSIDILVNLFQAFESVPDKIFNN